MKPQDVKNFFLFGGSGAGAAGFKDADPTIGTIKGRMVVLGGIDVDPLACEDFHMLTGVRQACVDLFSLQQYRAWHGRMPPEGWREGIGNAVPRKSAKAIGTVMGQTLTRRYYSEIRGELDLAGLLPPDMPGYEDMQRGGFVGWTRVVDCVTSHPSPWKTDYPFEGMESYGFVLADSSPIPFVPWKGRLGFFNVPREAVPA